MTEVIGIRFRPNGKIYFFAPKDIDIEVGDAAIVETIRGVEYGKVVLGRREIDESSMTSELKPVIRKATPEDDRQYEENKEKCKKAFDICLEKIAAHGLEMKLIDVEYTFDNNKVLFYFTADGSLLVKIFKYPGISGSHSLEAGVHLERRYKLAHHQAALVAVRIYLDKFVLPHHLCCQTVILGP